MNDYIKLDQTYSLEKSLDCLEKMGKLFPIVKTSSSTCMLIIEKNNSLFLCEIKQILDHLQISILNEEHLSTEILNYIKEYIRIKFFLDSQLFEESVISRDSFMSPVVEKLTGLRPIADSSLLICLIRTIISQQISLTVAEKIFRQFINEYGSKLSYNGNQYYSYPNTHQLKKVNLLNLKKMGIPNSRAVAIMELISRAGTMDFEKMNFELLSIELLKIKGIGPWTIEMLGLFYFLDHNSSPKADLGLHRAIESILYLPNKSINKHNVMKYIQSWKGNKAIIVYYLWEYWMIKKIQV